MNKNRIRIVVNNSKRLGGPVARLRQPQQLSLPLPEPSNLLILNCSRNGQSAIMNLLMHITPRWILDTRIHPRLDLVAGNRSNAFKLFDQLGSRYVDVFGRAGVSDEFSVDMNPLFWFPVVSSIMQNEDNISGPFLMLMDNDELIRASMDIIPHALSSLTGSKVSASVL